MIRALAVFLLLVGSTVAAIKYQSIGVNGTLLCGSAPTPGIRVRLWDNDMGELVDSPKQNSFTDFDGYFSFDDWILHNDEIDPLIRIAHDCNDGVKPGQRLFKFKIPKAYILEGKEVPKDMYFNLGTINLELKPYNEERYYKGDISKRGIIRPYAHKIHRARRSDPQLQQLQPVQQEQPREGDAMEEDSSEGACSSGLCTFSSDRKRRENEKSSSDEKSDEMIKKEEKEDDSGCSDGACPINLSRKRRENEKSSSDEKADEMIKKEEDSGCSDGACPIDLSRKRRESEKSSSDEKSDEMIKKDENEEESGCSDGACPIDLSRKRRHENSEVEVDCDDCALKMEKSKKNTTNSVFGGKDESPEDRIEPW